LHHFFEAEVLMWFSVSSDADSGFALHLQKNVTTFFRSMQEQKKITSRAKVNALVCSLICDRLFRAFSFDRDAASPRTEL
jgi:hypothetical protein